MKKNKSAVIEASAARLKQLAKILKTGNKKFGTVAAAVQKHGEAAYRLAVECGNALNEAKELVVKGEFGAWCEKHCAGISERTRQNYMKVATAYGAELADNQQRTIKEAYVELGIIASLPPQKMLAAPVESKAQDQHPVIDVKVLEEQPAATVAVPAAEKLPDVPLETVEKLARAIGSPATASDSDMAVLVNRDAQHLVTELQGKLADEIAATGPLAAQTALSEAENIRKAATGLDDLADSLGDLGAKDVVLSGIRMTETTGDEQIMTPLLVPKQTPLTPETVDAWLATDAGKDWWAKNYTIAADAERQLAPPEPKRDKKAEKQAADIAAGRMVRIPTGPPLTVELFRSALDTLLALVPSDAKWADYAVALDAASKKLETERKPKVAASAYTS